MDDKQKDSIGIEIMQILEKNKCSFLEATEILKGLTYYIENLSQTQPFKLPLLEQF